MMMRLSWGVGVRRSLLWIVRVVASTRVALSGMNRRSRAMARPGEGKGWAKAVPDEQAVAVMEVNADRAIALRRGACQRIWRG